MAATAAPQTLSQRSRKSKRAWRKNIDLTEISNGIENARSENIATGNRGLLADQPSSALFETDVVGDANIRARTRKEHGLLKADEIIAQRSAVPAISSKKRAGDDLPSNVTDGVMVEKRRKKTTVSHKEYQRLRQLAYESTNAPTKLDKTSDSAEYDLWDVVEAPPPPPEQDYLESAKPIRAPGTLKRAPVSLRADGRPQVNVSKPHAGRSYNPAFNDWSSLLTQEGEKELEAEQRRQRAAQEEAEQAERAAKAAEEADRENERTDRSDYESEWEGIQSDVDDSQLKHKRPQRKTQAERNKIERRKEAERVARHDAKMKQKHQQLKKIKDIKADLDKSESKRAEALQLVEVLASSDDDDGNLQEVKLRRRKFGKHAVPEQPLELVLPDELQDSLRKLKPEGNLLNDRFRNMMVQGKFEPRKPITQPKKPKVTVTEKWSHKDWQLV